MKLVNRDGGFFLCFACNLLLGLWGAIPAVVLLVLHFCLDWSIWWFCGAVALWLLAVLLCTMVIVGANRVSAQPELVRENKNPYSVKPESDE